MKKLILDVSDLLNHKAESGDQCIDRLTGSLKKREGIKKVELNENKKSAPQLCIYFDEEHTSEDRIKQIAQETGDKLDKTFGHLWVKMKSVNDTSHLEAASTVLLNIKGVMNVLVVPTGWIFLEFNKYITQESILRELIEKMDLVI
jgi:copper chaperone CopZ